MRLNESFKAIVIYAVQMFDKDNKQVELGFDKRNTFKICHIMNTLVCPNFHYVLVCKQKELFKHMHTCLMLDLYHGNILQGLASAHEYLKVMSAENRCASYKRLYEVKLSLLLKKR